MKKNLQKIRSIPYFKVFILLWLLIFSLYIIYLAIYSPLIIQRFLAIKMCDSISQQHHRHNVTNYVDILPLIEKIPYTGLAVNAANPEDLYFQTIIQGNGNCSQLVFGLAFFLEENAYRYQIVHMIPMLGERSKAGNPFLLGRGHTVINTCYEINHEQHCGIVDVLEAGLLLHKNKYVDLDSLLRISSSPNKEISVLRLNKNVSLDTISSSFYNGGGYFERAIFVVQQQEEIRKYFKFLQFLSAVKLFKSNKKVYDFIAIFFNQYPNLYLSKADYWLVCKHDLLPFIVCKLFLFVIRIFFIVALMYAIYFVVGVLTQTIYKVFSLFLRTSIRSFFGLTNHL